MHGRKNIRHKVLYIHVTVHRQNFLLNNQPDALIIQIYGYVSHFYMPRRPLGRVEV